MSLRERAVELFYAAASLEVLLRKPPTASRFISGELHRHIPELVRLDKDLKSIFYEANSEGKDYAECWNLILLTTQKRLVG